MLKRHPFLRGFLSGFRHFGGIIVNIINTVLLTLVYFISVGPTALIYRWRGRRFFQVSPPPQQESYWSDLKVQTQPIEAYYRQF